MKFFKCKDGKIINQEIVTHVDISGKLGLCVVNFHLRNGSSIPEEFASRKAAESEVYNFQLFANYKLKELS